MKIIVPPGPVALAKHLRQLAQHGVARAQRAVAAEVEREIKRSFRTRTAPDGTRWAPLKYRTGQPLVKTGALRAGWSVRVDGLRILVSNPVGYTGYQQYGTRVIPARAQAPEGAGPLVAADPAVRRALEGSP